MTTLLTLIRRNVKMFFKDKGTFLTSLIAPVILLFLFVTFLGNVYRDSISQVLNIVPPLKEVPEKITNGLVGGFLMSSLLAVCTVTVPFCANMQSVQDKVTGALNDFCVAPVKPSILSLSYFISTAIVSLIICYTAFAIGLIYIASVGWCFTAGNIVLCILDIFIAVLFGTSLSSIVCFFLSSQGGISAVGTLVSSVYGFLCGAYMPISQFGSAIQKLIACLPGTYGTGLFRNHFLNGAINQLENGYCVPQVITEFRNGFDCNIYFFDKSVPVPVMYVIFAGTTLILLGIYILMNVLKGKKSK